MTMEVERLQDLSVYYFIVNLFSATPSITIVDGYPVGDLVLPSIAVESDDIRPISYEMGNRYFRDQRFWSVDVFGMNKAQRDSMAYRIKNSVPSGIPVYDYNQGFPPAITPTVIGGLTIVPNTMVLTPVRIFPEIVEKLYWRSRVRFITEYDSF
jgi:hypothetical protein